MPIALVDGDLLRVSVFTSWESQLGLNTFLARISMVGAVTIYPSEVATQISTDLAPLYKAMMHSLATFDGVTVRRVYGLAPYERTRSSIAGSGPGTASGDPLPGQVAGLISLYTVNLGKKNQGRHYIPFPAEGDNDTDGTPTAGYTVGLTDIGDWMSQGHLYAGTVGNATVSAGLYPIPEALFHAYDSYKANDSWATQRKRGYWGQRNRKFL